MFAAAAATLGVRFPIVEHPALLHPNGSLAIDTSADVPRFDPGNEALEHLRREGYVVVRGVLANASELAHARELLWEFLEGAGVGVRRNAPETWVRSKPNQYGIVWEHGVGQSRLMWFLRTRPRLLRMFELVWQTTDLITSFEGFSTMPPAAQEPRWSVAESWFHTDQNAATRAGLQTIQSFTSLFDQDETTGAFVVVPRSWAEHGAVTRRVFAARPETDPNQQFLMLPPDDPVLLQPHARPRLVRCRAGDAVLWDSRTVHCNTPSLADEPPPPQLDADGVPRPKRAVAYCSAAPRARASAAVLRERQRAFLTGQTCTHWPFEMTCLPPPAAQGQAASDPLMRVGPLEKSLVGLTDDQRAAWLRAAPDDADEGGGGGGGGGGDDDDDEHAAQVRDVFGTAGWSELPQRTCPRAR